MPLTIEAHGKSYEIEDPGGIIGDCLKSGKPYELKALEHMYRATRAPLGTGTAIDIGAGIGNHTLWLAAVCDMFVASFEPLDHVRLEQNVNLNPDLRIRTHPYGLGDTEVEGEVVSAPEHVTGRALDPSDKVPIVPLDAHEFSLVKMIKIDVEGMEPEVLRGAQHTIKRFHPILYVEAMDKAAHRANAAHIPRGYKHTQTFGATPLEVWEWCP